MNRTFPFKQESKKDRRKVRSKTATVTTFNSSCPIVKDRLKKRICAFFASKIIEITVRNTTKINSINL